MFVCVCVRKCVFRQDSAQQTGLLEPVPCFFFPPFSVPSFFSHMYSLDCFPCMSVCADMDGVWSTSVHRASESCFNKHFSMKVISSFTLSLFICPPPPHTLSFQHSTTSHSFQSDKKHQSGLSIAKKTHFSYPVQFPIDLLCTVPESWHTLF